MSALRRPGTSPPPVPPPPVVAALELVGGLMLLLGLGARVVAALLVLVVLGVLVLVHLSAGFLAAAGGRRARTCRRGRVKSSLARHARDHHGAAPIQRG